MALFRRMRGLEFKPAVVHRAHSKLISANIAIADVQYCQSPRSTRSVVINMLERCHYPRWPQIFPPAECESKFAPHCACSASTASIIEDMLPHTTQRLIPPRHFNSKPSLPEPFSDRRCVGPSPPVRPDISTDQRQKRVRGPLGCIANQAEPPTTPIIGG